MAMSLRDDSQEELGVAADGSLDEGIPVSRLLRDGLAESKGIAASVVAGKVEVVGSDGG